MICYMCMRVYEGTRCPYCGFSPDTYEPFPTVLLPTTILANRYYIGAVLGKGGFGITYIGYDIAARRSFPADILAYLAFPKLFVMLGRRVYHIGLVHSGF